MGFDLSEMIREGTFLSSFLYELVKMWKLYVGVNQMNSTNKVLNLVEFKSVLCISKMKYRIFFWRVW